MRSVVSKSYTQIKETGKVKLFKSYKPEYADGEQMRDFIYVKDAVDRHAAPRPEPQQGRSLQLRHRQGPHLEGSRHGCIHRHEPPAQIEFIPMPENLQGKYQYFTEARMSKLRAAGYTAEFTSLEDAVADYIRTYYEK